MGVNREFSLKIRKTHRYLGDIHWITVFSMDYVRTLFSWTDIDEIHGDQFRLNLHLKKDYFLT